MTENSEIQIARLTVLSDNRNPNSLTYFIVHIEKAIGLNEERTRKLGVVLEEVF